MAQQAREGRPFKASDLPDTVRPEHREDVMRLLNEVAAQYEKQRQKNLKRQREIDAAKQQIPAGERDRMHKILDRYNIYLRSDDKRMARMKSLTAINKWLAMSDEERTAWFERVEAYASKTKSDAHAWDKQFYDDWKRREERQQYRQDYKRFKENADYWLGIIKSDYKRIQAYQTLGVARSASQDEIKKAWKRLVMEHHPDRGGDAQRFIEINDAYQLIGQK